MDEDAIAFNFLEANSDGGDVIEERDFDGVARNSPSAAFTRRGEFVKYFED